MLLIFALKYFGCLLACLTNSTVRMKHYNTHQAYGNAGGAEVFLTDEELALQWDPASQALHHQLLFTRDILV